MAEQRQAVIVIHGIGEQRPMATLRGFVDAVLDRKATAKETDVGAAYYSKPDFLSGSFELRRLVSANARARTDFYEFYWAHLLPAAPWSRIVSWYRMLMQRSFTKVPRPLRLLWVASWIGLVLIVAAGLLGIVRYFSGEVSSASRWSNVPWALAAAGAALGSVVRSYIGDAAVYLSPDPPNIAARQKIREAGVALLERVTTNDRYDRIIICGHSLGSVIGYDILALAWQRHADAQRRETKAAWARGELPSRDVDALSKAEQLAKLIRDKKLKGNTAADEWHKSVRRLDAEQRRNGSGWRVTDFITMGSPLTYADILLARDRRDFDRRARERELPCAPPIRELNGAFSFEDHGPDHQGRVQTGRFLNTAAVFGVVAWTNLYFPSRMLLWGDIIGGPLQPLFLDGVRDLGVKPGKGHRLFAHTRYWSRTTSGKTSVKPDALIELIRFLDLGRKTFGEALESSPGQTQVSDGRGGVA